LPLRGLALPDAEWAHRRCQSPCALVLPGARAEHGMHQAVWCALAAADQVNQLAVQMQAPRQLGAASGRLRGQARARAAGSSRACWTGQAGATQRGSPWRCLRRRARTTSRAGSSRCPRAPTWRAGNMGPSSSAPPGPRLHTLHTELRCGPAASALPASAPPACRSLRPCMPPLSVACYLRHLSCSAAASKSLSRQAAVKCSCGRIRSPPC